MKLLLDENLSFRLLPGLEEFYPGSTHVRDIDLLGAEDRALWSYAVDRGFVLVSKDADFYQRSLVHGAPPKVIWLRVGNAPTDVIGELMREQFLAVSRFVEDSEASFLPLRLV